MEIFDVEAVHSFRYEDCYRYCLSISYQKSLTSPLPKASILAITTTMITGIPHYLGSMCQGYLGCCPALQ